MISHESSFLVFKENGKNSNSNPFLVTVDRHKLSPQQGDEENFNCLAIQQI